MGGSQGIRTVYATLGPAGTLATVAGAVAVVVLGASLWSFVRAVATTAPDSTVAADAARGSEAQKAQFDNYLAQINGRTVFVLPGAPAAPEPEVVAETGPPPPPSKPTSYGGPPIIAMVLDTVWFEDGRKMRVGDPEQDDTEVLAVRAPWEAVLRWKGEEFTVPLFARDRVVIKKGEGERSALGPSPAEPLSAGERPGGGVEGKGEGGSGHAGPPGAVARPSSDAEEEPPRPPAGEKVIGPADAPVQEPDHPQVVVPRPAPGEKPAPQPVPEPPPPPTTPQAAAPVQKNSQGKAG